VSHLIAQAHGKHPDIGQIPTQGGVMKETIRYPERTGKWHKEVSFPVELCEICGGEMDMEPESGEQHCPVCENPEE
jgi:hypothetical protein